MCSSLRNAALPIEPNKNSLFVLSIYVLRDSREKLKLFRDDVSCFDSISASTSEQYWLIMKFSHHLKLRMIMK